MSKPKIIISELGKEFITKRQRIVAIRNVNMEFDEGEFVCIVGPSGCGKSTIIRMIDDIIKPTSGKIIVDGTEYDHTKPLSRKIIQKMGFIFQIPNLFPWLTIRQNVLFPLKIMGIKGKEYEDYADGLIDMIGMTEYKNAYPKEISGGMTQRVGVIRAMVHKPEILMMDEPFGALDEANRLQMNLEIIKIWKENKMTVVFITHNIEEAVLLGQKIYVMSSSPGRVIDCVSVDFTTEERNADLVQSEKFKKYCTKLTGLIGDVDLSNTK